jgi:hypothetical protein
MSKQSDLVSVSQGSGGDPLYIDTTNDRVGIGTSSPSSTLHVSGGSESTIRNTSSSGSSWFIGSNTSSYILHNVSNTPMVFTTNGTERMRIHASGEVIAGGPYTNPVTVNQDFIRFTDSKILQIGRSGAASKPFVEFFNANGVIGSIYTGGTSTSYNTSSDYRLKENVVDLDGAADRLAQIPVHRFNFIADPDTTVDGFLAHEVQEFVPEAITGEKDAVDADGNPEYQGIDQSKLVPLLTAALQEALQKIDALEARVTALETN